MVYRTYTPGPPLADLVDHLWCLQDSPSHPTERVLPSGTLELVVNLEQDELRIGGARTDGPLRRFPGAVVSGAYGEPFTIDASAHLSIVGVHFRPGGARPFVGVPPGALGAAHVDLRTLWGPSAVELRERLCAAPADDRLEVLERALLARLAEPSARAAAVRAALELLDRPGTTVGEVAARLELSRRRLDQLFTAEVGMPPKLFARVRRFQRARALARRPGRPRWGAIALASGYSDQPHLIRDFLAFSGFSPVELARRGAAPAKEGHVVERAPGARAR